MVSDEIRRFVIDRFLPGESMEHLRDDTRLISSGIIDSLALWDLIRFVETRWGVSLAGVLAEDMDRLQDIVELVNRGKA